MIKELTSAQKNKGNSACITHHKTAEFFFIITESRFQTSCSSHCSSYLSIFLLLCQLAALLFQLGVRKEGAYEEGMDHFTQELPLYSIHMSFEIDFKVQNEASFWYPMFVQFPLYHVLQHCAVG